MAAKTIEDSKTEIIAETVLGELMDVIIKAPMQMQMGWKAMTEQQQKDIILDAQLIAAAKIKAIVNLIASTDYPSIRVSIDKASIKSNRVLAQVSFASSDKHREQFIDLIDSDVVLTLVDAQKFLGEDELPEPDQGTLNGIE